MTSGPGVALKPSCTEASKLLLQVLVLAQRAWLPCGPETRACMEGEGDAGALPLPLTPSPPHMSHHLHSPKWKFTPTTPTPTTPHWCRETTQQLVHTARPSPQSVSPNTNILVRGDDGIGKTYRLSKENVNVMV